MYLQEKDWNAPGGVALIAVEYPNAIAEEFLDWLRHTSAWLENHQLVELRVRKLNNALRDYRERPIGAASSPLPPGPTEREVALKAQRQANMAKARAVMLANRAAKRELAIVE